jgi:hypothetical protein
MTIQSMTDAVKYVIANYAKGHQFHGNELHDDVTAIFPEARRMYVDTLMRMMRRHCWNEYRTVNQNKSLYEKI